MSFLLKIFSKYSTELFTDSCKNIKTHNPAPNIKKNMY